MTPPVPATPAARRVPGLPPMGRFWTAANALSLLRIGMIGPIAWMVYTSAPVGWTFALVAVAVATDFLDGRVARATGAVTEWGKVLDATADKLAAAAVTLALLVRPEPPNLPLWFVALAVARDAMLAVGGLIQSRRLGRFTSSLWSGKVAVTLLALTVVAALLQAPPAAMTALVGATTGAMAWSMVAYVVRFRAIARHGLDALEADGTTLRREFGLRR